jgi:hypothetical protein
MYNCTYCILQQNRQQIDEKVRQKFPCFICKYYSINFSFHKIKLIFPSPAGMSLTKLSLGGNNDGIYKLFPPRERLVSDIPAGDGNIEKLFYGVLYTTRLYIIQYLLKTRTIAGLAF